MARYFLTVRLQITERELKNESWMSTYDTLPDFNGITSFDLKRLVVSLLGMVTEECNWLPVTPLATLNSPQTPRTANCHYYRIHAWTRQFGSGVSVVITVINRSSR